MIANDNSEKKKQLLLLMHRAVALDQALRDQYHIGDKFRFIRDRLQGLSQQIQERLSTIQKEREKKEIVILEDEIIAYVYLYNAQGLQFQTWQKMLSPSVFYEYSVNRPIYLQKSHVEAFIRSKANKVQHGYLEIALKKLDVLQTPDNMLLNDTLGSPLVKIREGSLYFNRLVAFHHNDQIYEINEVGELIKKEE